MVSDLLLVMPKVKIVLGGPQALVVAADITNDAITVVRGEIEGVPASFYTDLEAGSLQPEYHCASGHPFPSPFSPLA